MKKITPTINVNILLRNAIEKALADWEKYDGTLNGVKKFARYAVLTTLSSTISEILIVDKAIREAVSDDGEGAIVDRIMKHLGKYFDLGDCMSDEE